MTWTRRTDPQGGYLAVTSCYGQRISACFHQRGDLRPYPWAVELGDRKVEASRTCADAKAAAVLAVEALRNEIVIGRQVCDIDRGGRWVSTPRRRRPRAGLTAAGRHADRRAAGGRGG